MHPALWCILPDVRLCIFPFIIAFTFVTQGTTLISVIAGGDYIHLLLVPTMQAKILLAHGALWLCSVGINCICSQVVRVCTWSLAVRSDTSSCTAFLCA